MPLKGFALPEQSIRSMQVVQDSQHSEALVELLMVEVMGLGRREEGEVVAGVGVDREEESQAVPRPYSRDVGSHEEGTEYWGEDEKKDVFHRMAVAAFKRHGSRPLVVFLVNVFVDGFMMEQPVAVEEENLKDKNKNNEVNDDLVERGKLVDVGHTTPRYRVEHGHEGA